MKNYAHQVVVRVDQEMWDALVQTAADEDRTVTQTVRRSIKAYLDQRNGGAK